MDAGIFPRDQETVEGSPDGGPAGNREDTFGQSRCHRVRYDILQCLLLHTGVQVSWRIRTASTTVV